MKWFINVVTITLIFIAANAHAEDHTLTSMGAVGSGIFIPTGTDADVARNSPILQLAATVMFHPHLGVDAEFHYIPVLLEKSTLSLAAHRKATQLALVGGLKATSSPLTTSKPIAYLAARAGFARIAIRTNSASYSGGWIGRPIDSVENPNAGLGFTTHVRQKGFVLSPKAGAIIPFANRARLDIALSPMFIFDSGDVTPQYHITLSFGLINR